MHALYNRLYYSVIPSRAHLTPAEAWQQLRWRKLLPLLGQVHQACQAPYDATRTDASVPYGAKVKVVVPFRESPAVGAHEQRDVPEAWRCEAQKSSQVYLARGRAQKVTSADDLADAHEAIIHNDGQLVCHHSVTPPYKKVSAVTCEQLLVGAVTEVVEGDDASRVVCVWHAQRAEIGRASCRERV